jgi:hypothetical protein
MFGACYYMLRDAVPYRDLGALSLQPPRQAEDSRPPHPTLRTCPFVALPSEADPAMRFGVSSSTSSPSGLVGHRLARNAKAAFEQPTIISDATNRRRREIVRDGRSERGGDCGVRSDGRPGGRRNVPGASRRRHMSGPRARPRGRESHRRPAESFKDQAHLVAIVSEAQAMVSNALSPLTRPRVAGRATVSDDSRLMSLPPFPPDYRASGLLLHVTSLPSQTHPGAAACCGKASTRR